MVKWKRQQEKIEVVFLCLKNNQEVPYLQLMDLSLPDENLGTYFEKVQYIMNCDIVIYECSHMCTGCKIDLDQAYQFRRKIEKSLEYWRTTYGLNEETKDILIFDIDNVGGDYEETNEEYVENTVKPKRYNNSPNKDEYNKTDLKEMSKFECRCEVVFQGAADLHNKCCPLKFAKNKNAKPQLEKNIKITKPHFEKTRNYVCDICNQAFKQSHHLLEHTTKHTGERNFKCSFCEKKFQRISSLSRHIKSHDALPGQKAKKSPFLCTICGKTFPYSNAKQRHMRMHQGIKPHHCNICNKRFSQMDHLKVHMRVHTGERPYVCDECGDSFKFIQTFQKHLTKHKLQGDILKTIVKTEIM